MKILLIIRRIYQGIKYLVDILLSKSFQIKFCKHVKIESVNKQMRNVVVLRLSDNYNTSVIN